MGDGGERKSLRSEREKLGGRLSMMTVHEEGSGTQEGGAGAVEGTGGGGDGRGCCKCAERMSGSSSRPSSRMKSED